MEFLEAALPFERKIKYRNMPDALKDVNILFSDKIVKPNFHELYFGRVI